MDQPLPSCDMNMVRNDFNAPNNQIALIKENFDFLSRSQRNLKGNVCCLDFLWLEVVGSLKVMCYTQNSISLWCIIGFIDHHENAFIGNNPKHASARVASLHFNISITKQWFIFYHKTGYQDTNYIREREQCRSSIAKSMSYVSFYVFNLVSLYF